MAHKYFSYESVQNPKVADCFRNAKDYQETFLSLCAYEAQVIFSDFGFWKLIDNHWAEYRRFYQEWDEEQDHKMHDVLSES